MYRVTSFKIRQLYQLFQDGKLFVNRRYQRNLVWPEKDKKYLVDSVFRMYPIPAIMLNMSEGEVYEVIDGIQRLHSLFEYIEGKFGFERGDDFIFFKDYSDSCDSDSSRKYISEAESQIFLNAQVPIALCEYKDDSDVDNIFLRINSYGISLNPQEIRQAGKKTAFSSLIKKIGLILRNDMISDQLFSSESIGFIEEIKRNTLGYETNIEKSFWCNHQLFSLNDIKRSEDEEIISDVILSIVLEKQYPAGRAELNNYYGVGEIDKTIKIDQEIKNYGADKLVQEVVGVFNHIAYMCREELEPQSISLRELLNGKSKEESLEAFYSICLVFHELLYKNGKKPSDYKEICIALKNLTNRLSYENDLSKSRELNVNQCKGLVETYFRPTDQTPFYTTSTELEQLIRNSTLEKPEYDFKQGMYHLGPNERKFNKGMYDTIYCTLASLANLGKNRTGYLFVGIADKEKDTAQIEKLDRISVSRINNFGVVGLEREALLYGSSLDNYVSMIIQGIRNSDLPERLKTQVNSTIEPIKFKEKTVLRITVRCGENPVWYQGKLYIRDGFSNYRGVSSSESEYIDSVYSLFK
ncbi:GmrSD restriction endonuclease domain-containing protein [Paenibacillus chitinolyticus]|uniref:DUF262 domain-containing protein n=1 Tax=Paenibacillus chitinolyticus TaxID=79263 RepID=A0ABT4F7U0_9BACL|nr:DUF262 domain-containing protein [Paenibacillus chitinolyticus]MCY9591587.1 DUF262 domain-containing protein [Paenibacillus chitinolyticus]MCY9594580.1 DUF262 domain-containing protein [Paenibacillus chitinolyticus]